MVIKENKCYSRWCKRCGIKYKTSSKHGRVCDNCNLLKIRKYRQF